MMPYENGLSEKQLQIFEVKWADCREKLGADIEGSMTKSILECHKIIGCECCDKNSALDDISTIKAKKLKVKEENAASGRIVQQAD